MNRTPELLHTHAIRFDDKQNTVTGSAYFDPENDQTLHCHQAIHGDLWTDDGLDSTGIVDLNHPRPTYPSHRHPLGWENVTGSNQLPPAETK